MNIIEIIKLIIREAKERDITLGATKLAKLLYLVDVEFYRFHREKTTNLKWVFCHYGPYALELGKLLETPELEIENIELEDEKLFKKITEKYEDDTPIRLDPSISVIVRAVVQEWGPKDLSQILNHVYFNTEPMLYAKKGDLLDFSTIKKPIALKEVKLDDRKLEEIREKMKQIIKKKYSARRPVIKFAEGLEECLDIWGVDTKPPKISGKFTITLESLKQEEFNKNE